MINELYNLCCSGNIKSERNENIINVVLLMPLKTNTAGRVNSLYGEK